MSVVRFLPLNLPEEFLDFVPACITIGLRLREALMRPSGSNNS